MSGVEPTPSLKLTGPNFETILSIVKLPQTQGSQIFTSYWLGQTNKVLVSIKTMSHHNAFSERGLKVHRTMLDIIFASMLSIFSSSVCMQDGGRVALYSGGFLGSGLGLRQRQQRDWLQGLDPLRDRVERSRSLGQKGQNKE